MKKFAGYQHGVNLGGWFSQCHPSEQHYDTFITERDFAVIAGWGLDHVRIPVDYELLQNEQGYLETGFRRLQQCADWCRKNGLHMVLDLHKAVGYSFDEAEGETGLFGNPKKEEAFCRLWEEIARHFGNQSDTVAFELLNEVVEKSDGPAWNALAAKTIACIRRHAPETYILVGSYWHNSAKAVAALLPPADDRIVFNFHCYAPLIFTHQGAEWISTMDPNFRIEYPSTYGRFCEASDQYINQAGEDIAGLLEPRELLGPEYFEVLLLSAVATAQKYDVPLYCGEYGVIDKADVASTQNWYRDIHAVFDRHGIGHAAWSYREMDFGLTRPALDDRMPGLLR